MDSVYSFLNHPIVREPVRQQLSFDEDTFIVVLVLGEVEEGRWRKASRRKQKIWNHQLIEKWVLQGCKSARPFPGVIL